jgi:hypothetical protein
MARRTASRSRSRPKAQQNPTPRWVLPTTITLGAVALGIGGYALGRWISEDKDKQLPLDGRPIPSPIPMPLPIPIPQPESVSAPAVEPPEGWEARWEARKQDALRDCNRDDEVTSWPQAITCLLELTYPEASPWVDPSMWAAWQNDAAAAIESDLHDAIVKMFGNSDPTGWELQVWLRALRAANHCKDAGMTPAKMPICVAQQIYPELTYPPPVGAQPWVLDFWKAIRNFTLQFGKGDDGPGPLRPGTGTGGDNGGGGLHFG